MVAGVAVSLDHHAGIVATEDDHALRVPLEKLLVHGDASVAVQLGDDLGPRHVVDVDEREARLRGHGRSPFGRNSRSVLMISATFGGTMRSHDGSPFSISASTSGVRIVR